MRKFLTVLFLLLATPALAQWQVATGYVPKGRGPGVIGFGQSLIYDGGTGCIGIGTISCTERFTVAGDRTYIQANRASISSGQVGFQLMTAGLPGWYEYMAVGSNDLRFYDGSNDRVTFFNGGGQLTSVGNSYSSFVKDVPYIVNIPVYGSGFSTQIADNSIFTQPGGHPTNARNALAIGMYALGSGVNGPTVSDVALQTSCVKVNYHDAFTSAYGEGECLSLFGRWGGPPGAGASNFPNNSDFALILGDGAITGTSGAAYFSESVMRAVDYSHLGGATTLLQQVQINAVNPRDPGGGLGFYMAAATGVFDNALLIGSGSAVDYYKNLIRGFNSELGEQYLLDYNGEQWLYPFNRGSTVQDRNDHSIRIRNDLVAGRFSVANAAGTNRFTVDGATGNTIATGYVSGTSIYLGANSFASITSGAHSIQDILGVYVFSAGTSTTQIDNDLINFRSRNGGATKFASIGPTGISAFGSTSGAVTIASQAIAGTYNFNLPTTAGTSGQVLTSAGGVAAPMTWTTPATGSVTSVSVASANGFAGSVATATTTPAITLSTTITGILSGNGTAISAASTTGSGSVVLATSPTLITPTLGTPSSGTLTNATGLPISTGVSGLGTGIATFLATPTSANLASAVTNETGSGLLVFATSPTLTTPVFSSIVNTGTLTLPTSTDTLVGRATIDTFTNKTFDTAGTGNSFSINGVAATANTGTGAVARATSPTFVTPVLGTPTSGTLTNATGLPISTGVSGLATGVATFLGTSTSANLASAVTDETGSGSLVFATSPTLVTPTLGVATATSINGNTLTTGTGTVTLTSGAVLTASTTTSVGRGQYLGTNTNDAATAGNIGEFTSATSGSTALTTGTAATLTSISLTAGDWDLAGVINYSYGGTTQTTQVTGGFGTADNTFSGAIGSYVELGHPQTGGGPDTLVMPRWRVNLAGTATQYIIARCTFTVSTCSATGYITARRVR